MPSAVDRHEHWNHVYASKSAESVSWYQAIPSLSLQMIESTHSDKELSLADKKNMGTIDVGAGASVLVDCLLQDGFVNIACLDISEEGLHASQRRLGDAKAATVDWIVSDIAAFRPTRQYAVWHDRAVLHFLSDERDRQAYVDAMHHAIPMGGIAVISTFALDGPKQCSGLQTVAYDAEMMQSLLGCDFELVVEEQEMHETPFHTSQHFKYFKFVRVN